MYNTKGGKISLGLLAGIMAFGGASSLAYGAEAHQGLAQGDYKNNQRGMKAHMAPELYEKMRDLARNGNYDEYLVFAGENKLRVMDEEQFKKRAGHMAKRTEAHQAVVDGDYDAWRLISGSDKMPSITQDNFYLLVEMEAAHRSGNQDAIDTAQQALNDAGIQEERQERMQKRGAMYHKGKHRISHIDQSLIDDMSSTEKKDTFGRIVEQIKIRFGLR